MFIWRIVQDCIRSKITIPYQPSTSSSVQVHAPYAQGPIGTASTVEQNYGPVTKLIQQRSPLLNEMHLEAIHTIVTQGTWNEALVEGIYIQTPWFSLHNITLALHPGAPERLIMEMIKATREVEVRSGAAKLLSLLRQLADYAPTVHIGMQVRQWATMFEGTLDAQSLLPTPSPPPSRPHHLTILISLEPDRHIPTLYQIRVWKAVDMGEYVPVDYTIPGTKDSPGDTATASLDILPHLISDLLNKRLVAEIRQVKKNVLIELMVPFALFNMDLEHLNVDVDDPFGGQYLGRRYPMVVRSLDRLEGWAEKWLVDWEEHGDWFAQLTAQQPIQPIAWFLTIHACASHETLCNCLDDHHGMALGFSIYELQEAQQYESLCRALLKRGIPVAIWSRSSDADPAHIQATITSLLNHGISLPMHVHQQRKSTHPDRPVYPITVLWDNPQHVPVL